MVHLTRDYRNCCVLHAHTGGRHRSCNTLYPYVLCIMQIIIRTTGVRRPEQGARRDDALFHRLHHWLQPFPTRAPFSHLHSSYPYSIPGVSHSIFCSVHILALYQSPHSATPRLAKRHIICILSRERMTLSLAYTSRETCAFQLGIWLILAPCLVTRLQS